jgi:hypothetical protein
VTEAGDPGFERLDFVYMPSRDVARDVGYFTRVVGAELVFAIESSGTRVAMVELAAASPNLLFADHLEGDQPILVYRVGDLEATMEALAARGWKREPAFEIPDGPCCSLRAAGGQRLAIYELTRPEAEKRFAGRKDF